MNQEYIRETLESRLTRSQQSQLASYKAKFHRMSRRFLRNRSAVLGTVVIVVFTLIAIFASYIAPYGVTETFQASDGTSLALAPPSAEHPMGTNHLSRDVFSQWVHGTRISLLFGLTTGFLVILVGSTVGLVSGYYKGRVDLILMRIVDILYGIPAIPFILIVALILGNNLLTIILAMVVVLWRTMARLVRSQTLSVAERPFVKAARAAGASDRRIIFYHIAPNVVPLILIEGIFISGTAILIEAAISFLGLGPADVISWGVMLQLVFSTGALSRAWWWVLPPGMSIALLVVSLFFVSRGLEDVTSPETTR